MQIITLINYRDRQNNMFKNRESFIPVSNEESIEIIRKKHIKRYSKKHNILQKNIEISYLIKEVIK